MLTLHKLRVGEKKKVNVEDRGFFLRKLHH